MVEAFKSVFILWKIIVFITVILFSELYTITMILNNSNSKKVICNLIR